MLTVPNTKSDGQLGSSRL